MNKELETIYNSLPSKWEDVTVADFIKLSALHVEESDDTFDGVDNSIAVLSVFTGKTTDELELMLMKDIQTLCKKLDFMVELPKEDKSSSVNWKGVNEITYGDFILYQQFQNDIFNNLHLVIPAFAKNKITEEEVMKMNVVDLHTAFFFLKQDVKTFLNNTEVYLTKLLKKQKKKEWLKRTFSRK